MSIKSIVAAGSLAVMALPIQAQVTSGHGSGSSTYSSRERACEAARDHAESMADAQVRWHKKNKGVDLEPALSDLTSTGDCTSCKSDKIYGQPPVYWCTVRWRLQ